MKLTRFYRKRRESKTYRHQLHKNSGPVMTTNYVMIGAICGSIFQIVVCVGVISGCVALCCWCHKKCRKRNQRQSGVNVVYVPTPAPPAGYQPSYPSFHHSPPPNCGPPPIPTAPPPSYQEATSSPGLFPLDVSQRPLMYPTPPQSEQNSQQPFNPAYCPPKYDHT